MANNYSAQCQCHAEAKSSTPKPLRRHVTDLPLTPMSRPRQFVSSTADESFDYDWTFDLTDSYETTNVAAVASGCVVPNCPCSASTASADAPSARVDHRVPVPATLTEEKTPPPKPLPRHVTDLPLTPRKNKTAQSDAKPSPRAVDRDVKSDAVAMASTSNSSIFEATVLYEGNANTTTSNAAARSLPKPKLHHVTGLPLLHRVTRLPLTYTRSLAAKVRSPPGVCESPSDYDWASLDSDESCETDDRNAPVDDSDDSVTSKERAVSTPRISQRRAKDVWTTQRLREHLASMRKNKAAQSDAKPSPRAVGRDVKTEAKPSLQALGRDDVKSDRHCRSPTPAAAVMASEDSSRPDSKNQYARNNEDGDEHYRRPNSCQLSSPELGSFAYHWAAVVPNPDASYEQFVERRDRWKVYASMMKAEAEASARDRAAQKLERRRPCPSPPVVSRRAANASCCPPTTSRPPTKYCPPRSATPRTSCGSCPGCLLTASVESDASDYDC